MAYRKKILVVEDNDLNREMLCAILSEEYEPLEAENGLVALDLIRRYKETISLVLLDVMMPVMDGYTFLEQVRKDRELSLIPVIVVTQDSSVQEELAALGHGATDFVAKPYHPQIIMRRISALINLRENAAMINQLQYDRPTGLYSRAFFYKKVQDRLQEDPDTDYCIICSNVENFKLVNNVFGTVAGEKLMQEIAGITKSMVGDTGLCGRLSADRIICMQTREQIMKDRESFGKDLGMPVSQLLRSVVLRWGIYEITDRTVPVELMCDRAMIAVDSIKNHYNEFYAMYDEKLMNKLLREQAITACMEQALEEEQFVVYYQAKYNLQHDCLAGAEALVRWIHPEWGFMSPGEFIPLFEKNGFIPELDRYVWEKVCQQLRQWQDQGLTLLPVSVNVSRADIFQPGLVDFIASLPRKYGIDPSLLHLEITESSYADNPDQIIRTVAQLRERGFIVEMDDFGSGYSSLNMLSQMSLDILKLDMKFIQNELSKPMAESLLHDVINMAHRVQMTVVAEGVETREQVNRLRTEGCDYAQGYFFSKPVPPAAYEELLRAWRPREDTPDQQQKWVRHSLLVLEENPYYRSRVRETFADKYTILEMESADSALQYLQTQDTDHIAAAIVSQTLPENGAASVLNALRKSPVFWNVPVLLTIPNSGCAVDSSILRNADDFLCRCHPMFDLEKHVQHMIDAATFRQREHALKDAANRDPLTGLLNRRGLVNAMNNLRNADMPLAVCYFDLDDLKELNDTLGHEAGDQVILAFSELLRSRTRSGDIKCRYGGDEFILLLRNLKTPEAARKVVEHICQSFRELRVIEGHSLTCSAGVSICRRSQQLSANLINQADRAMYRAKQSGDGSCIIWEENL